MLFAGNENYYVPYPSSTVMPNKTASVFSPTSEGDWPAGGWTMFRWYGAPTFLAVIPTATVTSQSGYIADWFGSFYFAGLHFTRERFDFGVIPETEYQDLRVWNAHREVEGPITITQATDPVDTSISVAHPGAYPFVVAAFEEVTYTVTVDKNGYPNVKDELVLEFDVTPLTKSFPIVGIRVVPFKFPPNWDDPVDHVYRWETVINQSDTALEQRMELIPYPKEEFAYQLKVSGTEAMSLYNYINAWVNKPFAVPMWDECLEVESLVAANSAVIPIKDTTRSTIAFRSLIYSPATGKIHTISSSSLSPIQTQETIVVVPNMNEWFEYTKPGAPFIDFNFSGSLYTNQYYAYIYDKSGNLVDTLTGLNLDKSYTLPEDVVRVNIVTNNYNNPYGDSTVTYSDNLEKGSITMAEPLGVELPAGSKVFPCMIAYLKSTGSYEAETDAFKGMEVRFISDPMEGFFSDAPVFDSFNGLPVYYSKHNWSEVVRQDTESLVYLEDYRTGKLNYGLKDEYTEGKVTRMRVLDDPRHWRFYLRESQRRRGRLGSFWFVGDTSDLHLISDINSSSNVIEVAHVNYGLLVEKAPDYRYICIQTNDGKRYYREVSSITPVGTTKELLDIGTALPKSYTVEEVKRISYMFIARMDKDRVVLSNLTGNITMTEEVIRKVKA